MTNPTASRQLGRLVDAQIGDTLTHLANRPLFELLSPPGKGLGHELETTDRTCELAAQPLLEENSLDTSGWVAVVRDVTREREVQLQVQ